VAAVGRVGDRSARAARRTAQVVGAAQAVLLTAAGAGVLATAALMASATSAGTVSGPMAVLLVLTPLALAEVLVPLADAGATAAHVGAAERRVAELIGRRPRVLERPGCLPADLRRPRLRLESVVPGWDGPACAPVDLDLGPGGRVGLVGPSGSGKSTLAETLARGLDPVSGRVLLTHDEQSVAPSDDGSPAWEVRHVHDLRDLPLRQVRGTVGVLGDDPHVFASTLRENLRLARPTASDGEIASALGSVSLATWYAALPHGLDTWLGDGGLGLSGGERARLGLARLVLSGHPVWVLDEPTAHLDAPLAQRLADVVLSREGAGAGRSVVWITHTTVGLDLVDEVVTLHPTEGTAVDVSPATSYA
jgi:ATP-binding cassette subfamily C protein CydCD